MASLLKVTVFDQLCRVVRQLHIPPLRLMLEGLVAPSLHKDMGGNRGRLKNSSQTYDDR